MADPGHIFYGPIVTRREALEKGLSRYFTGKPCKYGHYEQRQTKTSGCMACARLAARKRTGVVGPPCGTRVMFVAQSERDKAQLSIPFDYD